ncbi:MAG TPA: hypothetical protein PLU30_20435 [Verrucomicrobiae bacterium]|nr:hypothetical protein [Verrucomicrobiae bacterium]
MSDKPDDRPRAETTDLEPRIFVIVRGKKFPRPGLETFFAAPEASQPQDGCSCHPVGAVICTCMKVCRCVGHTSCSCVSHRSSGGGYGRGCRCAPVH